MYYYSIIRVLGGYEYYYSVICVRENWDNMIWKDIINNEGVHGEGG